MDLRSVPRYGLPVLGLAFGFGAFLLLINAEVALLLPKYVIPPNGEDLPDWLDGFQAAQYMWVLYPTLGLALFWHVFSCIKSSYQGDQRLFWFLLWAFAGVASALCISFGIPREENGVGLIASAMTLLNGVIVYWLATALFSTITHKFAPLGSPAVRRIW